jgi:cellulose synthase/poly-beta-1,6-N-acetylglucosamine synthase-like glycosyltransferase
MTWLLRDAITDFNWFVLAYFALLSSSYLLMIAIAAVDVARWLRRFGFAGHDDNFANPLTPGVSVLVPAYNEEITIVESVRAMLALKYPEFEVIVVDDGSTDETFARLAEAFELVEVPRVIPAELPTIGRVISTHAPASGAALLVVRKENARRRADALNVALGAARQPLVCMVDADSLLEGEALLRVVKPFIDDPRVVGTGGVIRTANGCRVEGGRVVHAAMPRRWIERVQVLEYLRSFLLGRTGWSRLGALLIISGAFGVFRRDVVVEAGGMDLNTLAEDAELVLKIHRTMRGQRRDYRIAFVPEPVCWTEVPHTTAVLARQRRRWSQGLAEVLWKHRDMMANPRYGRIGLFTLPYYLLFELLGPVLETAGLAVVIASFALGIVNLPFALVFAGVAFGYGMFVSDVAVAVEEFSFHRYRRWRDLATAALAAALENLGYRQAHSWWRLQGLWRFLRGRESHWGVMTRVGFAPAPPPAPGSAPARAR